jgi:hypothetical protein
MKYYFFLWSSWLLTVYAFSSFFFPLLFDGDPVYRNAVSNFTFSSLNNKNLQISIRQETVIVVELDKITQEGFQACFAFHGYARNKIFGCSD